MVGLALINTKVFITERQNLVSPSRKKWDGVIPPAMFVSLVCHLAEAVPAQVAGSCQKPGVRHQFQSTTGGKN